MLDDGNDDNDGTADDKVDPFVGNRAAVWMLVIAACLLERVCWMKASLAAEELDGKDEDGCDPFPACLDRMGVAAGAVGAELNMESGSSRLATFCTGCAAISVLMGLSASLSLSISLSASFTFASEEAVGGLGAVVDDDNDADLSDDGREVAVSAVSVSCMLVLLLLPVADRCFLFIMTGNVA